MTKCVVKVYWGEDQPLNKAEEYYIMDLEISYNHGVESIYDQISRNLNNRSWTSCEWQIIYI